VFFWDIMERRYPGDFQRVTTWGSLGDLKNDGYRTTTREIFQCYGPAVMNANEANTKIQSDYHGAIDNWNDHFHDWIFVHNALEGLPAPVLKKLLDVCSGYPDHPAKSWGYSDLRGLAMSLPDDDLIGLLGESPTIQTMLSLGYADVQPIIESIQHREPDISSGIQPVPEGKVERNAFSSPVRVLLQHGLINSQLVSNYFKGCGDPGLHDRISAWLRQEYGSLRAQGQLDPDGVFDRLRHVIGGVGPADAMRETAVLAIVAYFFAICEIFEPSEPSEPTVASAN
jgi:hypothetical protein